MNTGIGVPSSSLSIDMNTISTHNPVHSLYSRNLQNNNNVVMRYPIPSVGKAMITVNFDGNINNNVSNGLMRCTNFSIFYFSNCVIILFEILHF